MRRMRPAAWVAAASGLVWLLGLGLDTATAPSSRVLVRLEVGPWLLLSSLGLLVCLYALGYLAGRRLGAHDDRLAREDARRAFIRRLDHELGNPLLAIELAVANAASSRTDSSLDNARHQLTRLKALTRRLRTLADLERSSLSLERVAVGELIDGAVVEVTATPLGTARTITVLPSGADLAQVSIVADYDLVLAALTNLLSNALKYSDPADEVQITWRMGKGFVRITVADRGHGIPIDEQGRVFEELYRGEAVTSVVKGSGIGLPLARRIAALHGGDVTLTSKVREGTRATLTLPLEPARAWRSHVWRGLVRRPVPLP